MMRFKDVIRRIKWKPASCRTCIVPMLGMALLVAAGCKSPGIREARQMHSSGQFDLAAEKVATLPPPKDHDTVWVGVESGAILMDAGYYGEARARLDETDLVIRAIDEDEEGGSLAGFANTAGASMFGDQFRDYLPRPHERVLLHQARTVCAICSGDAAAAAPIMRQAADIQHQIETFDWDEAVITESDLDEAASGDEETSKAGSVSHLMNSEPMKNAGASLARTGRNGDNRVPSAYFTEFVAFGTTDSWSEAEFSARKLEESVTGFAQVMKPVKDCLENQDMGDHVWVLVGNGMGPVRYANDIRVPVPLPGGKLTYFKASLPMLQIRPEGRVRRIHLRHDGKKTRATFVDSPEDMAIDDFNDRIVELWGPPLIRGAARAIAVAVAQNQTDNALAKIGILAGGIVLSEVDEADDRIWATLPAEHYIVAIPRPSNNVIEVLCNGKPATAVQLGPEDDFAYIRIIDAENIKVHAGNAGAS